MGGKGSRKAIVGYKYYLGVQMAVCHGPVDEIRGIVIGERDASTDVVTYGVGSAISVNKPDLFGGESREGGVVGNIDILWGDSTQARNAYLTNFQGANCPAYRGILSLVFKSFMWSSGNPYFKAPWIRLKRITAGWRDNTVWNSTKAAITGPTGIDMNPAHIIYQCLTDIEWGMGYNYSDIDTASFTTAAQTLYDESFGLSLMWDQQSDIQSFVKSILDHIDGTLRLDMKTGKFVITLNRGGYVVSSLTNVSPSNIIEFKSFQRAAYGEFANEVVVTYVDRDGNEKPVAVQDLASVQAQGAVVSTSRSYPGIRESTLAAKVAMRDLRLTSTPLAKASITTNRVLYDKEVGDVISLTWSDRNITTLPMRIIKISKGSLTDGKIECDLVEDVFGLPSTAYTSAPPSSWVDTVTAPAPAEATKAYEAGYWEIVMNMSRADIAQLEPGYGFGLVAATRGVSNNPLSFTINSSPNNSTYTKVGTGHFLPTGTLAADITRTQTSIQLSGFYDLSQAVLDAQNGYAMIDNEFMAVVSANASTGAVVVRRGVLDTVPAVHSAGARMYFITGAIGYDPTERTSGETTYYKALPRTGIGELPLASATPSQMTFANRATRPYPPGQFKVNSSYWPNNIDGILTATWVGRDRTQQTVSLIDYSQGNIGPEVGATYTLRLYDPSTNTLKKTYTNVTSGWNYPVADDALHGYIQRMRITLVTVVGGNESLYPHDHTFERYGLGFHLADSLGGIAPP